METSLGEKMLDSSTELGEKTEERHGESAAHNGSQPVKAFQSVGGNNDCTSTVLIDFVILPEGYGQTKEFPADTVLSAICAELEQELMIPNGSLFLLNMTEIESPAGTIADDRSGAVVTESCDKPLVYYQHGLLDLTRPLSNYLPAAAAESLSTHSRLETSSASPGLSENDSNTLMKYHVGIELRIQYYEPEDLADSYVMPDVLDVRVLLDETVSPGSVVPSQDVEGNYKIVQVYIDRSSALQKKCYLGGFVNRSNGTEYHHASSQTPTVPSKRARRSAEYFANSGGASLFYHRETQTTEQQSRSCQSTAEAGVQFTKPGLYISNSTDKVMFARAPYFSADQLDDLRLDKVLLIQSHSRGMLARRRTRLLRQKRQESLDAEQKAIEAKHLQTELENKAEIKRRMHPRTKQDFHILYRELEAWRISETQRIKDTTAALVTHDHHQQTSTGHVRMTGQHAATGSSSREVRDMTSASPKVLQQQALHQLLYKETQLLQTIDRLKLQASKSNRDTKTTAMLQDMAQPKLWPQSDGETTTVHTPFTTRAKQLMDLYTGLKLPFLSLEERLDVLLHVKWTVKEFDCSLSRDIVELIDREADLLNRGRPEKSLRGLKQRLAHLFLEFLRTPKFNPEATSYQKVTVSDDREGKLERKGGGYA
eukprot:GHVQ01013123.1.p1 GENE.GHVQ01013123.1~~GHVQ01013123.1.p1  ORF type:complete len:757 (+),score=102.96 GHVQ01013123.1:312-2273(+)